MYTSKRDVLSTERRWSDVLSGEGRRSGIRSGARQHGDIRAGVGRGNESHGKVVNHNSFVCGVEGKRDVLSGAGSSSVGPARMGSSSKIFLRSSHVIEPIQCGTDPVSLIPHAVASTSDSRSSSWTTKNPRHNETQLRVISKTRDMLRLMSSVVLHPLTLP